jgi:hypothetical protein
LTDQPNSWQRRLYDALEEKLPNIPADQVMKLAEDFTARRSDRTPGPPPPRLGAKLEALSLKLSKLADDLEHLDSATVEALTFAAAQTQGAGARSELIADLRNMRDSAWVAKRYVRRGSPISYRTWLIICIANLCEAVNVEVNHSEAGYVYLTVSEVMKALDQTVGDMGADVRQALDYRAGVLSSGDN